MPANETRLEGLHVRYRDFELGPVDLTLSEGCTALLGTNGAGKSTLMRAMLGLESRAHGRLALGSLSSDGRSDRAAFRRSVGWVPQAPDFPRFVTARQCLEYAAGLKELRGIAARQAVEAAAAATDLTDLLTRPADTLSGGQQKRLAIAQAIVHTPRLLVLDEPTAGLDPVQRRDFRAWLGTYAARHQVLVSTHVIEDVQDTSDNAVVLHRGKVVFSGSTHDLLEQVASGGSTSLDEATAAFLQGLDG